MATNLGTAYVTIMPSMKGFSSAMSAEMNGPGVRSAGKSAGASYRNSFASSIRGLGRVAAAALASAAAAGGAVLARLAKQALESYADYEQLVGGVDTLYEGASEKVQKYAAEAYKTVGMSANEYMEQATSFAATLRQSLGGDVSKAADQSNKALTDMADNANKMGTDLSRITDAYQGFAKQNYTMLDNLKLGYGGTKTEMERLLQDAEKLSGQKYDISNFSDVVDAIHVVQDEMGITGTTAKEASKTISGSIGMMKSAWQNWLIGLGDENADMGKLTDNLVDAITVAIDNIAPRLGVIASKLSTAIPQLVAAIAPHIPEIIGPIAKGMVDGLAAMLSALMPSIDWEGVFSGLTNALSWFAKHPEIVGIIGGVAVAIKALNGISGASGIISMVGGIGGKAGGAGMAQAAKAGMSPGGIAKGMAGIGIIVGSMAGIVVAFGALKQIPGFDELMAGGGEEIKKLFEVIGSMASFASAGFVAAVVGLGMAGVGTAASGMAALAAIIGGMTAVCAAYGALRMIPGFDELINDGAEGLVSVFRSIGAMVGALAEGFAVELSNAFPAIGENLGKFAANAKPFFDAAASTDIGALGSFVDGVASLSGISVLQQFDFGESELSKLGTNLADFAANVKPFFTNAASIGDMSAGNNLLKSAENFKSLSQVTASSDLMSGESKLEKAARQLSAFAQGIKPFYDTAAQITDYSAGANLLNEAENFGKLAGVKTAGENLPAFGENLVKFADSAREFFERMASVQGAGLDFEPVMSALEKLASSISASGEKVSGSVSTMSSQTAGKLGAMRSSFSTYAASIASAARGIGAKVKSGIKTVPDAVVSATSRTKTELSKLSKAFSGVSFNMRKHIDLPHFTVSGNFDLKSKKVPTTSVAWYAKGALATSPAVVGVGEGRYDEALLPLSPKVLAGIGEGIPGGGSTFNITMHVDGARDPEAWAADFARGLRRQVRMGAI